MASESTVLYRCPASLALPTADPYALAVETMLRMRQARFTKKDAPCERLRLCISAPTPGACRTGDRSTSTLEGLSACMQYLDADGREGDETLGSEQRLALTCVETLTVRCLFPAFNFIVHYDTGLYTNSIGKSVATKVATVVESLCGTYRRNILRSNPYFYKSYRAAPLPRQTRCGAAAETDPAVPDVLRAALTDVENAMTALELLHVKHARQDDTFLLGTAQPSVADAYAYAAVSCFLHAEFEANKAAPCIVQLQQALRQECPQLVKYVERLRRLLYDEYCETYNLKPIKMATGPDGAREAGGEDVYREGRTRTLVLTGVFAAVYFVAANVLPLLQTLAELTASGALAADDLEDAAAAAPPESHHVDTAGVPREGHPSSAPHAG